MNGVQGVSDAAVNTVLVSCAGATGMACFAFGFRHLQERVQYRVPLYIVGLCAVRSSFFQKSRVYLLGGAAVIAAAQFITKRTVRFHISNLLHKTGNKTQIAMIAHFHKVTEDTALLEMDKHTSESSAI